MGKKEENWTEKYLELKAHVERTGHFPNKHTRLNNWCKYQRKRLKEGLMTEEQQQFFKALCDSRSHEHTGGKRPKTTNLLNIT